MITPSQEKIAPLKGPFSLIVVVMTMFLLYDYLFLGVRAPPVIAVTVFNDHCFPMMAVGITITCGDSHLFNFYSQLARRWRD